MYFVYWKNKYVRHLGVARVVTGDLNTVEMTGIDSKVRRQISQPISRDHRRLRLHVS